MKPGKPLTNKQLDIYNFIESFISENGYSHTVREIGEHFHITVKAAYDHLDLIEKKGALIRNRHSARTIRLNAI